MKVRYFAWLRERIGKGEEEIVLPAEVLTAALFARFRSRKEHTFAEKLLSAMRDGFGGHKEPEQHDAPDIVKPKASRS